ncbi:hypothetical protein BHE74_00033249 [Ensete ventricosum]|nr:hypothetical protein GW17_00046166 [Ensete ventricosum]RWW59793.1 hypothetical protein BHE74_00033249 [Ensete ventricosum]RZS15960.1 hypothetical protein BHM03_00047882 [Ensete ventricosum]
MLGMVSLREKAGVREEADHFAMFFAGLMQFVIQFHLAMKEIGIAIEKHGVWSKSNSRSRLKVSQGRPEL